MHKTRVETAAPSQLTARLPDVTLSVNDGQHVVVHVQRHADARAYRRVVGRHRERAAVAIRTPPDSKPTARQVLVLVSSRFGEGADGAKDRSLAEASISPLWEPDQKAKALVSTC